jgi:hypothetical protein
MCNFDSLKKKNHLLVLKKIKIFILILFLFGFVYTAKAQDENPPPPPGNTIPAVPIDDSLLLAIVISVSFGIYIICKNKLKQKTPI